MRKNARFLILLLLGVAATGEALAGMSDKLLRFSTVGPDRYADGSVVVDGECYALVWSPAGKTFSGFNADGTPVSSSDYVVLAGALAQGGRCRDAIFQVPAVEYAALEGGEWAVCLVDTRNLNGVPVGVRNGLPLRVNRWGAVSSGVNLEPSDADKLDAPAASGKARLGAAGPQTGVRTTNLSAVPPGLQPPQITAMEVGNDEVWLAVDGTVPYLDYTIISGETPDSLKPDYFSEVVEGDGTSEIAIGTVKSVKRRFFKVKRAE